MNIWKDPYPSDLETLIEKAEACLIILRQKLQDINCKRLGELYQINQDRQVVRNRGVFDDLGYKPNSRLNNKSRQDNEFKGLYLFGDNNGAPIYVGISRTVYRRLRQHGWGQNHNEATLAYLKASVELDYKGNRSSLPWEEVQRKQELMRTYKVALLAEPYNFDLYFMEVYLAGRLKTLWNSFKTH